MQEQTQPRRRRRNSVTCSLAGLDFTYIAVVTSRPREHDSPWVIRRIIAFEVLQLPGPIQTLGECNAQCLIHTTARIWGSNRRCRRRCRALGESLFPIWGSSQLPVRCCTNDTTLCGVSASADPVKARTIAFDALDLARCDRDVVSVGKGVVVRRRETVRVFVLCRLF